MTDKPLYTPALLRKFDRLTMKLSSRDQMERVDARLIGIPNFIKEHGKEVCDAMFEVLKKRDAKRGER